MDDICQGEAVWDSNLTWNGDWPQFTGCFQHAVLPWMTCGCLWVTSLFYVLHLIARPVNVLPTTALFIVKLFACTSLVFLRIIQILNVVQDAPSSNAEILDYSVHLVTYGLLVAVLVLEKRKGVITSPVLFFFWLLSLFVNIIPFYSKIKLREYQDEVLDFCLFYAVYAFTMVSFVVSCVAERIPPGFYNTNGNLEVSASVLSRLTFWWPTRMLIVSYRGVREDKLLALNPRDSTASTVPVLQAHLREEEVRCSSRGAKLHRQRPQSSVSFTKRRKRRSASSAAEKNEPELQIDINSKAPPSSSSETTPLFQGDSGRYKQYSKGDSSSSSSSSNSSSSSSIFETKKTRQLSMLRAILRAFWKQMLCVHSIVILQMVVILASPLIMRAMIQFTEARGGEPVWRGYLYAGSLFLMNVVRSLCQHSCLFLTTCLAIRVSGSLTSAVYRKALRMNSEARRGTSVGEIVNLMSVDAHNIEMFITYSFWVWLSSGLVLVPLYLLYTTVGVALFAGAAFMAALFAVNTLLMNKLRLFQRTIMTIRDKRVKVINEMLNGIKILKLYAWEPSFEDKVTKIRDQELSVLLKVAFIDSFICFSWFASTYWITLFTFMTYVFVDESHTLDASTAFVALSYFDTIRVGLNIMPIMIREGVKSMVSMGRISSYLNTPDLDTSHVVKDSFSGENAVVVTDGSFSWDKATPPALSRINLEVERGSLVAVVGQVGVGKSSLLSAILGEMETVHGCVNITGSIAYVPQQAWIQNDTLKNNILFGRDCDHDLYHRVLHACALEPDLEMLPAGDMTEIGEKGINLSGGQKQRVSVARAVYSDPDVILLDDPLSAVDSHVGRHMFEKVIGNSGLLRGKTRILVTHGLQWLPRVDCIVVLSEGRVTERGTYQQLLSHDGPFAQFLTSYLITQDQESESDEEDEEAQTVKRDILQRLASVHTETEGEENAADIVLKHLSGDHKDHGEKWPHGQKDHGEKRPHGQKDHGEKRPHSQKDHGEKRPHSQKDHGEKRPHSQKDHGEKWPHGQKDHGEKRPHGQKDHRDQGDQSKLMTEEEADSGQVNIGVYRQMAKSLGYKCSLLMLILYTASHGWALGANLWLTAWVDDSQLRNLTALPPNSTDRQQLNRFYLGVYTAFGVAQTVFIVLYSIVMALRRVHAARTMHQKMLNRLLRAPMAFFDTTPLGRIVNRFSQDMDMLDTEICLNLEVWTEQAELLVSSVLAITITTPIFLAVFAPASLLYYLALKFYIGTSCQLRRLQSKKRSPIYSHFGETLTGAHVIRAYGAQQRFIGQSESRVDAMMTCTYNSAAAASWLGIRLDFLGSLLVLAAAIFTVVSRDTLSSGNVGLSLTYALEVTGYMGFLVKMSTDLENSIVSLERIAKYTTVQSEADWVSSQHPKPDWPRQGHIRFQGYSTRYRPGLDLVLHDLTCDIKAGEKVGIVGRTGAGKSSLTLALFRLIEAASGHVVIDDVDIASLGLHDVRNKLNILPQDPVIFDGTLRMNLDPFEQHSDQQVWTVLDQAHLKAYVAALPDRLQHLCGEGGENLSVGQRQLVCLARALLRKTKILVLDEATAAVDLETDDLIQTTIRQAFQDCTVLTIAHRINTVMDYDRILVLDNGRMIEFDSPTTLLQDSSSSFYSMAKDAGLV
ncbi:multidrug resistance-associated protein 1-like [Babylonia areolata]|uniref:multidrug resistance-associated protein 1-like n=1 Tax=Babylonia areolata TaxID=304850 RepID=UPI003FD06996